MPDGGRGTCCRRQCRRRIGRDGREDLRRSRHEGHEGRGRHRLCTARRRRRRCARRRQRRRRHPRLAAGHDHRRRTHARRARLRTIGRCAQEGPRDARRTAAPIADGPFRATTLAVIATNVPVTKTNLTKLAMMANTGCARAINPYHTQGDGDQVLAVSTGMLTQDVSLTALGAIASEVVADAIGRAVRAATTIPGWTAVRDL